MTTATYKRKDLIGGLLQFQRVSVSIMEENMAAGRQTGVGAESSHVEIRTNRQRENQL